MVRISEMSSYQAIFISSAFTGQSWWKKHRLKLLNNTRGPLVQIMWSSDITISNITLQDSPFWTLHPYDCKNITVKNVTILAPIFDAQILTESILIPVKT